MKEATYHHGNLKNELIEAGITLISVEGINGFSLRKVATKCGVSHAAPYSHFADVEELTKAMGEYVTEKFMKSLSLSIEKVENSRDAVTLLGNAYITFFSENPHYFQFLFYHSNININLDENNGDDYPPFILFKQTVYKLFEEMHLPKEEYTNSLLALWSMVHGIVSLLTNKGVHYSGDWNSVLSDNCLTRR